MKYLMLLTMICLAIISCRKDELVTEEPINEPIEEVVEYEQYIRTIVDGETDELFVGCQGRMTKDETLIYALDSMTNEYIIIGIKGFEKGDFKGNLWGLGGETENGVSDAIDYTIEKYEDVGGVISGSFDSGEIQGDFIAERIK